jgi:HemY protein
MIRTLLIFLLFLVSVCLGVQVHNDPGYVLIALNHWTIESTVWTMLITILFVFFILHLFLLSLNWVLHLPKRWRDWRLNHSTEQTIKKIES